MTVRPNLIIFVISLLVPFLLTSCSNEKNDVVPDIYTDFYINLNDPEFFVLASPFTFVYISSSTNNIGLNASGFDGNGIIVFRNVEDEFLAFDRTCPHDFKINNKSVRVNVVDDIFAVCPECSTKYALPGYGTPASGVGQYPLKNYKTSFNGLIVHVWNN